MTENNIPKGKYLAHAIDSQWGTTGTNLRQVAVTFVIDEGDWAGHEITWFGYFAEKTTARTMESLRTCGWVGDDLSNLGALDQQVELVVEHETYKEKTQVKVAWVNRPGQGRVKLNNPMSPEELKRFAQEMRGAARATPVVAGQRVASTPPSNGSRSSGYDERNPPPSEFPDDLGI
jgi:hypothetical protein